MSLRATWNQRLSELVVTEIAEEFSEDALDKSNSTYCTAREVATKLCIAHRFCDPTTEERRQHAVFTDIQREEFWLTRLSGSKEEDILFICGDDHIESFSNRLTMAGYPNKILSRRWGFRVAGSKSVLGLTPNMRLETDLRTRSLRSLASSVQPWR